MKSKKTKALKSVFKGAPFLHIIFPFIVGIICYDYTKIKFSFSVLLSIVIFLFGVNILLLMYRKHFIRFSIISKLFLGFLISFIAILVCWENDIKNDPHFMGYLPIDSITIWQGIITENPTEKANTFLVPVAIQSVKINDSIKPATGKIVAYIKKENFDTSLKRGQVIYSNSKLTFITTLGNPGEFNYQQYINRKNIYYQTYITYNVEKGQYEAPFFILRYIEKVQQYILYTLDKYVGIKSVNGIAKALVIGYRQDLDADVYQQYVNMGVVHVIAISGLHVGIISYVIGLFLWGLYQQKKSKIVALVIHLVLLWGFCFLAGGTPSILRACACFTILELGKHLFRPIRNPFQSLALSAFIILCIDPMSIFHLGFILSYSALIGLFLVARHIQDWINPKTWLFKKITEIVSATLAAQIFVIPISLFLFHQFSIYFIITNLLIVPLSSLVLIGIIVLLSVGWISFLATFVACITTAGISIMNFIVSQASALPYSLFTDIPITFIQVILLYIIAIVLVLWIQRGKRKFGLYITGILVIYFTILLFDNIQRNKQQILVVLNTPKQTNIAHIQGKNATIYTSSQDTMLLYKKYIHNLSYYYGTKNIEYHWLDSNDIEIHISNHKFHIINYAFVDTFQVNKTEHFIFANNYHSLYNLKKDSLSTYIVSQQKMERILAFYKTHIINLSKQGAYIIENE